MELVLAVLHLSELYKAPNGRFAVDITCISSFTKLSPVHQIYLSPRQEAKANAEYKRIMNEFTAMQDRASSYVTVMHDNGNIIAVSNYNAINNPKEAQWIDLTPVTLSVKQKPYSRFDCNQ